MKTPSNMVLCEMLLSVEVKKTKYINKTKVGCKIQRKIITYYECDITLNDPMKETSLLLF